MDFSLISAALIAVPIFVTTNIDDMLILLAFFADPGIRKAHVFTGQIVGMGILVSVSLVLAMAVVAFPKEYVGLLGFAPIAIGVSKLPDLWRAAPDDSLELSARRSNINMAIVATATVASGGDNIGVYAPLFAVQNAGATLMTIAVFSLLTLVWCLLAMWMAMRLTAGNTLRRYGPRFLPIVMMVIGLLVMKDAGTFRLFIGYL